MFEHVAITRVKNLSLFYLFNTYSLNQYARETCAIFRCRNDKFCRNFLITPMSATTINANAFEGDVRHFHDSNYILRDYSITSKRYMHRLFQERSSQYNIEMI